MKNKNYPLEIIPKKIRKSNVTLIGVKHKKEFFQKHKKFLEKKINESPEGIVLEQLEGGEEFWKSLFFSKFGEIAYKNDIPVYQADPINESLFPLEPTILSSSILLMIDGHLENSLLEFATGLNLFFGNLRGGIPVLHGIGCILNNIPFSEYFKKINDTPRSFLTYGQTDWRNIRIAKGIEKICEGKNFENLTAFHGALHTKPIEFCLDNPKIREVKNIFYFPFNLCGKKGVRKYVPANYLKDLAEYNQSWKLEKVL